MNTTRRPNRSLHLIDVENLTGSGTPSTVDLVDRRVEYASLGLVGPCDHLVIASNPYIAVDVGMTWPCARLTVAHGADGADRALATVVFTEGVDRRYDHVVVASGDAYFVEAVVALQHAGVPVTVVSRSDALSNRLRLAATNVIVLGPTPQAPAHARAVAS